MTSLDLHRAVRRVVTGAATDEQVEAYGLERTTCSARAGTGGEVLDVAQLETRGIGVRVITAGRSGYASTAELTESGLDDCLRQAREGAFLSHPDPEERLPSPHAAAEIVGLIHPDLAGTPLPDKIALAVDLARRATAVDRRVRRLDTAAYVDERTSVRIASTTGLDAGYERGFSRLTVDVMGDDGRTVAGDYGSRVARSPRCLDVDAVAVEAVERTTRLLGPRRPAPSGVPVVLDPEVAAVLIAATGRAFTADAMRSSRGPFSGRDGQAVAAPCLTLVDDGVDALFPAAAPFDDEGVPRQRTPLVEAGTAVGTLHSTRTARWSREVGASTGNARRGSHRSPPTVAPTTLVLAPTTTTAALLAEAPVAVYIQQLSGGRAGVDAVTGRVDVGAIGWLLSGGEVAHPCEVLPVSTRLPDLLLTVRAVGDDARAVPELPVAASTVLCDSRLLTAASR